VLPTLGRDVERLGAQVIDGKTLKGSYNRERQKSALHVVSAWAVSIASVLGQVKVCEKSNEITAIPPIGGVSSVRLHHYD